MGVQITDMAESKDNNKLINNLWEAFQILSSLSTITRIGAFKVIIALFAYKRFCDSNILKVPADHGWNSLAGYPKDELLIWLEHSYDQLQLANELPNIASALKLKQFNERIPNDAKEYLINVFGGMDLSPAKYSTFQINAIVDNLIQKIYSQYNGDVFENKSLNRLVIKLLSPTEDEVIYLPQCGAGDIVVQIVNYYEENKTTPLFDEHGVAYIEPVDLQLKAAVSNIDIWVIASLRILLADIRCIDIKNEDYFNSVAPQKEIAAERISGTNDEGIGANKKIEDIERLLLEELKKIQDHTFEKFDEVSLIDALPHLADAIFFISPVGSNLPSDIQTTISIKDCNFEITRNQSDLFYLLRSIKHLYKKGRLGIVLPSEVLFKDTNSHKKVREFLIEEDLLEAIVQLPLGIFPQASLKWVLLIINTDKPKEKKHKFAFMIVKATRKGDLNLITEESINKAIYVYKNFTSLSNDYIASLEEIQQQDYNLLPSRYLGAIADDIKKIRRSKTGRQLSEICRVIRGTSTGMSCNISGIPVISTKNLSKDIKDLYLTLDDISYVSPELCSPPIEEKCIIVSLVGNDLKPTIFNPEVLKKTYGRKEILLGKNVAAIFPDNDMVDFEYLYYQLNSSLIKTQIEERRAGAGIPHISLSQLKDIIVPLLSKIEEQKAFSRQQKTELLKAENAKYEALREKLQIYEEKQLSEYEVLGAIAHTFKNEIFLPLQTIVKMKDFLNERNLLNETIFDDLSAGDLLEKSQRSLELVNSVVKTVKSYFEQNYKRDDFKEVNICELFRSTIKPLVKKEFISINILCDVDEPVKLHQDAFILAFSNILNNAETHGFPERIEGAEIHFDIHKSEKELVIDYRNNGIPLPKDIAIEDFIEPGKKREDSPGYGLGGWIISRVIKDVHGGTVELIRDKNAIHLRMIIPLGD
jgi:type I restriction enzyme M protein